MTLIKDIKYIFRIFFSKFSHYIQYIVCLTDIVTYLLVPYDDFPSTHHYFSSRPRDKMKYGYLSLHFCVEHMVSGDIKKHSSQNVSFFSQIQGTGLRRRQQCSYEIFIYSQWSLSCSERRGSAAHWSLLWKRGTVHQQVTSQAQGYHG